MLQSCRHCGYWVKSSSFAHEVLFRRWPPPKVIVPMSLAGRFNRLRDHGTLSNTIALTLEREGLEAYLAPNVLIPQGT